MVDVIWEKIDNIKKGISSTIFKLFKNSKHNDKKINFGDTYCY